MLKPEQHSRIIQLHGMLSWDLLDNACLHYRAQTYWCGWLAEGRHFRLPLAVYSVNSNGAVDTLHTARFFLAEERVEEFSKWILAKDPRVAAAALRQMSTHFGSFATLTGECYRLIGCGTCTLTGS